MAGHSHVLLSWELSLDTTVALQDDQFGPEAKPPAGFTSTAEYALK